MSGDPGWLGLWRAGRRWAACFALALLSGCWTYVTPMAQSRFDSRRDLVTLTIYPPHVACQGHPTRADPALGRELVDWMNGRRLARATLVRPGVPIAVEWGANQAAMAQRSAEAFGASVARAALPTDYALLVELLCNHEETAVIAVHYYLAERSGLLAAGGLANSHHEEFKRLQPKDRHAGLAVAEAMIERRWRETDSAQSRQVPTAAPSPVTASAPR